MSKSAAIQNPASVAEQSVIGCILVDENTLSIAREIIKPQDFYCEANRAIFATMCALEDNGKPINLATLASSLSAEQTFVEAGGINYLVSCNQDTPSASQIEYYAAVVRNDSIRRKLSVFADTVKGMSQHPLDDADTVVSRLSDELQNLSGQSAVTPWVDFSAAIQSACRQLTEDEEGSVISTGFVDLDAKMTGFRPGALTIVAARPAMGKTAFGLNIMSHAAFNDGLPVAFFSLEMTADELTTRTLSSRAKVNGNALRQKTMNESEWDRILDAARKYAHASVFIDETPALDISTLRERARRLHRQHNIRMIIVDYLQLMRSSSKKAQNREQEVADISRGLKAIAKELHVPVIALAQLNRAVDARADKRPVLSDLRESGSIEQDADNILFIHREDYYRPNAEQTNEAEIIIAKQRSGPTGIVKLHWAGEYTLFSNLEGAMRFV